MNRDIAEQNLQTIRLLMERSALYRRALAPIMLAAGGLGVAAAVIGRLCHLEGARSFNFLWLGTAGVALTVAFLMARRQAFQAQEAFWTPPTCRVSQALLPPLTAGAVFGLFFGLPSDGWGPDLLVVALWLFFYGCALHSAGFFMTRGIKWFGWVFIAAAGVLLAGIYSGRMALGPGTANAWMGATFGGLHLAYGIYLYFTERNVNGDAA